MIMAHLPESCPPRCLPNPQVDDRLNGDGTGLPVGVNDPALTTAILGAFFLVWVLWYNSQKDLGDDAGLDL